MSLLDLTGKRGLVVGIANANSIAYGCAKAFHAAVATTSSARERVMDYVENRTFDEIKYLADAQGAGIVLGARVPIILTSRVGRVLARMASCAVALVAARRCRVAVP